MRHKRHVFQELFPGPVNTVLGILGLGVAPVVSILVSWDNKYKVGLAVFLLAAILWIGFRCLLLLVDLVNENTPTDIKVRTNRGYVTLLPQAENDDSDAPLESDHSVCICIWNQGRDGNCTMTLRFPSCLRLNITEEQAHQVDKRSDLYSRTVSLPKGEVHLLTINKVALPANMVEFYRETSRQLRLEVTFDAPSAAQTVMFITVTL